MDFREQFYMRPIFVNDDVVDGSIQPTAVGKRAQVVVRPLSSALGIKNELLTRAAGSDDTLKLDPELPNASASAACDPTRH